MPAAQETVSAGDPPVGRAAVQSSSPASDSYTMEFPQVGMEFPQVGDDTLTGPGPLVTDWAGDPPPRRRKLLLPVGALIAVVVVSVAVWFALSGGKDTKGTFAVNPTSTAAPAESPTAAALNAAPTSAAASRSRSRAPSPSASTKIDAPRPAGDPYAGRANPPSVAGLSLLGAPNYAGFCASRNAGSAKVQNGVWWCTGGGLLGGSPISQTDACRFTYSSRQVVAAAYDESDPYSWRCYSRR